MIVSVCADKGAPGVTDLATVLGVVWPGHRVLLEADVAGGDLSFRLRHADGDRLLDAAPSVLSLAADARGTLPAGGLARYAQPTVLGVPVVPGALSAEAFAPMARLWPQVAQVAAGWEGTAIADLGRLQPGNPASVLARASTALLLLARPDLAGLYHLRERVAELAALVGDPAQERTPVAVVVRARPGQPGRAAVGQVRQVLEAAGFPVPVAGVFAEDPAGAALLREGELSRRLLGGELVRSARALVDTVLGWWPELVQPAAEPALPEAAAGWRRWAGALRAGRHARQPDAPVDGLADGVLGAPGPTLDLGGAPVVEGVRIGAGTAAPSGASAVPGLPGGGQVSS